MTPLTTEQDQAIQACGNVLVVAGAGTGKTRTLVERCLARIKAGCSLERILMVTFTDAAAAEMRRRIRAALQESAGNPETVSDAVSSAANREHLEKQLALLDTANISTLHSFCFQLVRHHFYELGLDPAVTVLDEQQTRPLIQQTLDTIFERHYAGGTDSSHAVQSLVRVQGRGADERIRSLVLKLHRYSQSLANPERWLAEQLALFQEAEPGRWRAWFVEGFCGWRALWLPALEPFAGTPAVAACINALTGAPNQPAEQQVADAVRAIQMADGTKDGWPHGSKIKVRKPIQKFFAEAGYLGSLLPSHGADPIREDWELVRGHMLALVSLVQEFAADFSRAKRELGGVDFADLEQFSLRVLREPDTGELTATAARWREQFEYVFVDEYQDINAAQDAILSALSRDGAAANRFLVGDVKQSIYRFRLADPTIFRAYEQSWGGGQPHSQKLALAENFRSREAILNFINPLFAALMREKTGGVAYAPLRFGDASRRTKLASAAGDPPRVELHLIASGTGENSERGDAEAGPTAQGDLSDLLATEREARLVALRLRELHETRHEIWDKDQKRFRPVEFGDMAVLLRSPAGRAEAFAKEFDRLQVPLVAARGGFFASTEITDLICLLKLIDNPLQDIPLLAVLRSPLVGLSLDELATVRAASRERGFWMALRRFHLRGAGPDAGEPLIASAWEKVDLFLRQYSAWRELMRHTSVSHGLETALAGTHYEELLRAGPRGESRVANVRRLLELARQYDPYLRQGLFRFLRFVAAQEEMETNFETVPPATENAARLMSIHKSKGLEFPVVALAGLGCQFNLQDLREDILLDERYGLCPKVLPPDGEQRYPSLPHWLAGKRQRRELLGEELRLLYVAMTRAQDALILTGTVPGQGDPKWISTGNRALTDLEVLSARSFLGWLQLWLPLATREADWTSDRAGQSDLLRWSIYSETDPRLARIFHSRRSRQREEADGAGDPESPPPYVGGYGPSQPRTEYNGSGLEQPLASSKSAEPSQTLDESGLETVRERVAWRYPFAAATQERAKTNVTELRRRRGEEDDESQAARFVRRNVFADSPRQEGALSAAAVGTAHHIFLECVSLERTGSVPDLQNEAAQMRRAGILSEEEAATLHFDALAAFWRSELGQRIRAQDLRQVHREMPFTARLAPADLTEAGLPGEAALPEDEFVVVQGVMDLVVIRSNEIWLVDFKTDHLTAVELPDKVKQYAPQLKLYGLALSRIYRRPVTERWLHFLSLNRTAAV